MRYVSTFSDIEGVDYRYAIYGDPDGWPEGQASDEDEEEDDDGLE